MSTCGNPPPHVAYIVSDDLIRYSDRLPSNIGRSTLVHTLAYHLDLLDVGTSKAREKGSGPKRRRNAGGQGFGLLEKLAGQRVAHWNDKEDENRSRARIYSPHEASTGRMTAYHEACYVAQLAKGPEARHSVRSAKRQKVRPTTPLEASDSDSASEPQEADESVSFDESNPSSSADTFRKHGGSQLTQQKNQFGLQDDCPPFEGLYRYVQLVAGASISAAERLVSGQADIAIAWDGGRHHAKKGSASGFCYINDAVLAIVALRKPTKVTVSTPQVGAGDKQCESESQTVTKTVIKRLNKVLYLDLDLHWGDGVEEAFHNTPNVMTLSIHHYASGFFPCYAPSSNRDKYGPPGTLDADPGAGGTTLNIPLAAGTSDATFERIMQNAVQPLVDAWRPEAVVVQCGVDGLSDDPMKTWNLSSDAYIRATQRVFSWKKPTLLLGGGGYSSINAARVWAMLTAVCLGRYQPDQSTHGQGMVSAKTNVPDHEHWHCYNTGFTLEVEADNSKDLNTEENLQAIEAKFKEHARRLSTPSK